MIHIYILDDGGPVQVHVRVNLTNTQTASSPMSEPVPVPPYQRQKLEKPMSFEATDFWMGR